MSDSNPDFVLYSAKVCPFVQRTLILLNFKKVDYKVIEIDLDNKPADFLKLSPSGKVPLLIHKDKVLYESAVINEYLEEILPSPRLLSDCPHTKALMRIWIGYCNSELIPAFYKLLLSQDETQHETLKENLLKVLNHMETTGFARHSKEGCYFFDDTISLVDITFYPFFERFVANEYYRGAKIPKNLTHLRNWIKTMRQLPQVKPTANPPEFYIQRYAKYADGTTPRSGAKKIIDDLWQ